MNDIKPIVKNETEEKPFSFQPEDVNENKGVAALSYFFILILIPFFVRRNSKFVQAHLKQGLILCVLEAIAMFLFWIPVLGPLLWLALIISAVYAIYQTLNGHYWRVPLIGIYAEKIKIPQ